MSTCTRCGWTGLGSVSADTQPTTLEMCSSCKKLEEEEQLQKDRESTVVLGED